MTKKDIIKILLFNALLIAFLFSLLEFYYAWTNTLSRKPPWKSSKVELEKGVMGAWSFVLTYRALAHRHLDLGTWHGYQEVTLNNPPEYSSLSVDFKLDTLSYLCVFFNDTEDTLLGLRVSTDTSFQNCFITVKNQEFIDKQPINNLVRANNWHTLKLYYKDDTLIFNVDGQVFNITSSKVLSLNMLSFRGGPNPAMIDNISLHNNADVVLFKEDFSRERAHTAKVVLLFILGNLIFFIWKKQRSTILIAFANLASISLTIWIFFLVYGQDQYPREWMIHWGKKVSTIEAADTLSDLIVSRYGVVEAGRPFRIMFIGSSQTWGAGASTHAFTFVQQIERQLNQSFQGLSIQCINAGISGINSSELLSYYKHKWLSLKPDVVLINLSLNDSGSPGFQKNLEEFVTLNQSQEISTLFVLEPLVMPAGEYHPNHEIMMEVAHEYGIPCIDMHSVLAKRMDEGFLYWDFVHLTNFGQQLFAEELLPYLEQMILSLKKKDIDPYHQGIEENPIN